MYRALRWAASRGHATIVERILQQPEMDVNTKIRGATPLFLACSCLDRPTVELLLRLGADPNILCNDNGDEFQGGMIMIRVGHLGRVAKMMLAQVACIVCAVLHVMQPTQKRQKHSS
jgi:ankyrin repeat protein